MTNTSSKILIGILTLVLMTGYTSTAIAQEVDSGITDTPIAGPGMSAGPVPTDGTWFEWSFTGPPFAAFGCLPADPFSPFICVPSTGTPTIFADTPPYTFVCPAAGCTLSVTDAFNQGDQFDVFDGGLIGSTSVVALTNIQCAPNATDPVDCMADPDSSSGTFALAAGPHSITFLPTVVAATAGAAYFNVVIPPVGGTMIPIDSTALLLAGAQMNADWLIPVIVVAIGFAIVIARKY